MAKNPLETHSVYTKITVISVGAFLITVLLFMAILVPSWRGLKQIGTEIAQAKAKHDRVEADAKNLENAKKYFETHTADIAKVTSALPTQPDQPTILAQLDALARANGVSLTSFVPSQVQAVADPANGAPSGVDSVEISANYSAKNFVDLQNYFYSLERSLRIVDVKSVSTSTKTGESSGQEGSIVFRAYYKSLGGGPGNTAPNAGVK